MTAEPILSLTERQEARRRRLIRSAISLASDGGYEAVQMRAVATDAGMALGTIYRYFASKDHLLAAAMAEWTAELQMRMAEHPPAGGTRTERMIDVYRRACRAMERQPQLTAALMTAIAAPADPGVDASATEVRARIGAMTAGILDDLDPEVREGVVSVLGHVWHSTLLAWANGQRGFGFVTGELERAIRLLLVHYEEEETR